MAFIDEVKVYLKAGKGGNGCISFRREKFVSLGGPDGGNGGKGGDIIFQAGSNINTLLKFHYKPHLMGNNGGHGSGGKKQGSYGTDMILDVPIGTQIHDLKGNLIIDLLQVDHQETVAKGGPGGAGNTGSRNYHRDRYYNSGSPGEETTLLLKLKIIADVGVIGLPNAGKSTFLSLCSNARPKIADYEFTTLVPEVGIVQLDDNHDFIMADIPGLIEGAYKGLGLGHKFLKHIERCAVVLHLIDCTQEDIISTYNTVRNELKRYNEDLATKNEIVAISKCDLQPENVINQKVKLLEDSLKQKVYKTAINTNNNQVINQLYGILDKKEESENYSPI